MLIFRTFDAGGANGPGRRFSVNSSTDNLIGLLNPTTSYPSANFALINLPNFTEMAYKAQPASSSINGDILEVHKSVNRTTFINEYTTIIGNVNTTNKTVGTLSGTILYSWLGSGGGRNEHGIGIAPTSECYVGDGSTAWAQWQTCYYYRGSSFTYTAGQMYIWIR